MKCEFCSRQIKSNLEDHKNHNKICLKIQKLQAQLNAEKEKIGIDWVGIDVDIKKSSNLCIIS